MEIFSIVLIVSLIGNFVREIPIVPNKFIPTIGAIVGAVLGVVFVQQGWIFIEGNILDAAITGVVSGLSATGAHQLYTQAKK